MSLRSRRRIPVPTPGREDQDDAREQDEPAHDQDDAHEQYGIEETQDDPAHEPAHELAETQDAQTEAADEQDEPAEPQQLLLSMPYAVASCSIHTRELQGFPGDSIVDSLERTRENRYLNKRENDM